MHASGSEPAISTVSEGPPDARDGAFIPEGGERRRKPQVGHSQRLRTMALSCAARIDKRVDTALMDAIGAGWEVTVLADNKSGVSGRSSRYRTTKAHSTRIFADCGAPAAVCRLLCRDVMNLCVERHSA